MLSYGYCIVCLSCCPMAIVLSVCHVVLWLFHCLSVMLSYGYCIVCLSCCPMAIVLSVYHVVIWLLHSLSVMLSYGYCFVLAIGQHDRQTMQ
jgi:accessory gene regulator protein AgrB